METKKSLAQNEFIEIEIGRLRNGAAMAATAAATNATAVFELQIRRFTGEYTTIQMNDPTAIGGTLANLTGPGKIGWADVPGAEAVRVIRTDATGGDGTVGLTFREG